MIVRWGLGELAELAGDRGLLVASRRWAALELGFEPAARWTEVPSDRVDEAATLSFDRVVAVGGGSAIDLGKAISAASGADLVSVPTTYSGAEWTSFFGVRDPSRRMRGGGGGAHPHAIVYEPRLTLGLPRAETVGTALNALAHSAEALYASGHNADADEHALAGARAIAEWLPRVVDRPDDVDARTELLRGACHAGAALAGAGLALGHAMAQAVGGRYGLPHGTLNAICLPPALRFNEPLAPDAVARLAEAVGGDPAARVEELARLADVPRLRDLGVPEEDLPALAAAAAARAGNQANPRPASPAEIEELLRSVW